MDKSPAVFGRPTWAEIDLSALAHNYRLIRGHVGDDVKILAAVKANAYGHGAVECARRLEAEGCDWFGVALPEEGIELRNAGITRPILCLAGFWNGQERLCLQHKLTPVVYTLEAIKLFNSAALEANVVADVHLKIDTGMGRLGVRPEYASELCNALTELKNIRVDGLMTHLAAADDQSKQEFTNDQIAKFDQTVETFRERGFQPSFIHAANSAATFSAARSSDNLVRPGGSLYGFVRDVFPGNIATPPLKPVMSLYSRIILVKVVPRGEKLGYGCTFETHGDSKIATLPIGYDDGYARALSNRGHVIVRGHFAPVVGRVSMDLTLIDVTDIEGVQADDRVILLGNEGERKITAEELGATAGTISYEITCGISNRVPRICRNEEN